jgi:PAS domain S-box-containing protein
MKPMKAAHRAFVSLIEITILIALIVVLSFWAFIQIKEAAAERKHTFIVISSGNKLLAALIDAETSQRGYLLTGDKAFLKPYFAVRDSISSQLEKLRRITLINAAKEHLNALPQLIDAQLAYLAHNIELYRNNSMTDALANLRASLGKQLMDPIRAQIRNFIQLEEGALEQHDTELQSKMRLLIIIIVIASLFLLLFSLLFVYSTYRATKLRLKNLVHSETQHLLEVQEETNKQLQQANITLQVSEEQLAVTLNSIGDAVLTTDADGRLTGMNPLAEQLTGWTLPEATGRPVDEIFHIINQETRQPATIPIKETLAHGTIQGLANHTILIARDGSECDIADSCAPIRDRNGQVIGAVLVFRDVTVEYARQQALRDNAALIQTILNTVVDGIITLHAGNGTIETVNPAAERMFSYNAADLIGQSFSLLIPELDLEQRNGDGSLEYFRANAEAHAMGLGREVTGRRKNGSVFPLEIAVSEMWQSDQLYFTGILRDITSRKQAEEALLKAGPLQNAIFNSANFSSIATDEKGVIQIFNVGAERMLGYSAVDVMNKITPADISDPQEVIARAKALSAELSTPITPGFEALVFKASRGIEDIYELTYIRKDGSRFPAIVSVTALRDDQDIIIGYLLIGTDNTARKQAEEALLKAGALQNAIFNSANFSSIATDAKGVIQIFNVGAERMLGYSAVDVMNKITPADISDPQEVIARAKALSAELGTPITPGFEALVFKASRGIEDIYELTYIRKDGSRFPAIVSVTALRDDKGAIIGYLLIGTDNTARKQVEAEQKQLSQRLRDHQFYTRSLFEANIDALMTTDPSGIITDVNKQMEELTGCTRDELIGAPFKSYFTDPEQAETCVKLVLSEKKVTNYELTARARDEKETVVSVNATTFYDRDRKLQGVFAAARDVTERKRLDQVLQEKNVELESARAVAEKANLAKSEFLSSMSHELRSPLNAILGFAQLLESDSPPPTPAQNEGIAQILGAGWHLLKLIDEILDLAKVESKQVPLSHEPVSLIEIMSECQGMIEPQAQQRGIRMIFPQFAIPCFVLADRIRVKQVLINLLSNAIKYNSKQGTVEVDCSESTPGRIRVSIRDTGAGLYPQQLAQLFQAFNRLGQEAGGEEGTGIGLVVAKRLVELMGGVIGVESTIGVGSVFWFELNAVAEPQFSPEESETEALAHPHVPRGAGLHTLLYVEDNPANLKLVEQIIARHPDMRLLTAVNGNSGIEIARAAQPDVILMDINLPGINGFEALDILSADPATAHIPIIALSANAMPLDIERGLKAGFFRYIIKPIKVSEFMEALDVALEFSEKNMLKPDKASCCS